MELIKGITYDQENVESLDDAREQHSNAKAISGNYATNGYMVYAEYENGLTAITSGTQIQINNFFGMVQGRMCKLAAPIKIDAVLGGNGTVLLTLDLTQPENNQIYLETTQSASVTQQDCLNEGKKFQAPIFTYTSTTTAVTTVTPVPNVAVGGDFQEKLNVIDPQTINSNNGLTIEKKNGSSSVTLGSFDTGFQISNGDGTFLNVNNDNEVYTDKGQLAYTDDLDGVYVKKTGDIVSNEAVFKSNAGSELNFDANGLRMVSPEAGNWIGVSEDKTQINSVKNTSYYAKDGHDFTGGDVDISSNLVVANLTTSNQFFAPFGYRGVSDGNVFTWLDMRTKDDASTLTSTVQDNYTGRGRAYTYEVKEGLTRRVSFVHADEDSPGWYFDGAWRFPQWVGANTNMWYDLKAELMKTRENNDDSMDALMNAIDNLAQKQEVETERLIAIMEKGDMNDETNEI